MTCPEGEEAAIEQICRASRRGVRRRKYQNLGQRLLHELPDDNLRRVAIWKMEGHLQQRNRRGLAMRHPHHRTKVASDTQIW